MAVLIEGDTVLLRDFELSDLDVYISWMVNDGIWKRYDAPWEEQPEVNEQTKQMYADRFSNYCSDRSIPRKRAGIVVKDRRRLIGWVNRYAVDPHPDACMVGIDICVDNVLGKGYGSEALFLWVEHLFSQSEFHRIGLATYSFNVAMQKVAEKSGFTLEVREKEIHFWNGEWIDRLTYGLLRKEWSLGKRASFS